MRLVHTPCKLVGASLEVGVAFLTRRIPEACNWRLTVFTEDYAESDEGGLPWILTIPLMMKEMVATGPGLGLLLVSLFRVMKTVISNRGVKVHLAKVWAMLLTRSLNHYLQVE